MNTYERSIAESLIKRLKEVSRCTCEYLTSADPAEQQHDHMCEYAVNQRTINWAENWLEFYRN